MAKAYAMQEEIGELPMDQVKVKVSFCDGSLDVNNPISYR